MSDFAAKRILSLDLVRAVAILLVLISHARQALVLPDSHMALTFGGWFGVELFFALSGFLIGTILYKMICEDFTIRALGRFWFRRWMRTLPAYFAILLFVWWYYGLFDASYFILLQWPITHSFRVLPVSWSLAVEEWFYIILPILACGLSLLDKRRGFPVAVAILILFPTLYRVYQYANLTPAIDIRVNPFRFDAMGYGVLAAYLMAHERSSNFIRQHKTWLFSTAACLFFFELWRYTGIMVGFPLPIPLPVWFSQIGIFTIAGVASALIVLSFHITRIRPPKIVGMLISYISTVSYSLYLWHLLLFGYLIKELDSFKGVWLYFVVIIAAIITASGPYLIEVSFIRLRDKLTPKRAVIKQPMTKHPLESDQVPTAILTA